MADDGSCLPDDVLVQIFELIPAGLRRPLRLVCKVWRNVIDERTPPEETILPRKILVFINQGSRCSALVFDDGRGCSTHEWTFESSSNEGRLHMVGTCNGLLCLHDHTTYGGISFSAVMLTNPVTGETAALPPVPTRWSLSEFKKPPGKYSFGFHPETKLHKVVYIPRGQQRSVDDAVQVFTFTLAAGGKQAWREVPVPIPGACYDLLCEPVTVGGSTYWLPAASSGTTGRVMALDLRDERVTSLYAPPAMGPAPTRSTPDYTPWRLTKVHASLGVVVSPSGITLRNVDVWVLDGGQKPQWERRYSVAQTACSFWVMAPQLTHGNWILSASWGNLNDMYSWRRNRRLYRHEVGELTADGGGGGGGDGRQMPPRNGAELFMRRLEERVCEFTTFAYVETQNPVPAAKELLLSNEQVARMRKQTEDRLYDYESDYEIS